MEQKNFIIIAVVAIIICVATGAILGFLTNNTQYERIEIVPNGTSIEMPTDNLTYEGEQSGTGAKLWSFKQGSLMSFNSQEAIDARGLYGLGGALGIKQIKDLVIEKSVDKENINEFTVYTVKGKDINISSRDTLYVIITGDDTTHDNIIIATENKDITVHMAESIQYKSGNATNTSNDNTSESASQSTADKTYPLYDDTGKLVGYYHVGDTVEMKGIILQLQSDGTWKQIGESTGSSDRAYSTGYKDAVDDMSDDYDDYSSDSSSSHSSSSKSRDSSSSSSSSKSPSSSSATG